MKAAAESEQETAERQGRDDEGRETETGGDSSSSSPPSPTTRSQTPPPPAPPQQSFGPGPPPPFSAPPGAPTRGDGDGRNASDNNSADDGEDVLEVCAGGDNVHRTFTYIPLTCIKCAVVTRMMRFISHFDTTHHKCLPV